MQRSYVENCFSPFKDIVRPPKYCLFGGWQSDLQRELWAEYEWLSSRAELKPFKYSTQWMTPEEWLVFV